MKKDVKDIYGITAKDVIFRYKLESNTELCTEPLYKDKVVEFFRREVVDLLDVVELTYNGEPVKIDGFAFINEPNNIYRLFAISKGTLGV